MLYDELSVNKSGHLVFAGADTVSLSQKYGTALFVLDLKKIEKRCDEYKNALSEILGDGSYPLYAGKALCIKALYPVIKKHSLGIDVVSAGEIHIAASSGFPMENAFFHGNAKTDADIAYAFDSGVGYFVCDSSEELCAVENEAKKRGARQKILIRITPGIDPHTHAKITTGNTDSKFGFQISDGTAKDAVKLALSSENIELCGFHCHIGSQIFTIEPYYDAARIMLGFAKSVKDETGYSARIIDLGGGFGVRYTDEDPKIDYGEYTRLLARFFKNEAERLGLELPRLLLEPGRSIVADSGITLYSVVGKKTIKDVRTYVATDGGMTDNPRFSLYGAKYTVINASHADKDEKEICTVAGKCCESGDIIAEDVGIYPPERKDILAVLTTGAYNYSMASHYNAVPRPPVVMLCDGREFVAVERESFEKMSACQKDMPEELL